MFDADSHSKAFGLQGDAFLRQHPIGVVGGVTYRQYYWRIYNFKFMIYGFKFGIRILKFEIFETCDASLKMDLAAVLDDALAHGADDRGELVGADMGVGLVEDGIRCAEVMEEFHHALHVPAFLRAGEEFAIGERTRAALAEAVVRFGVETDVTVELGDVAFAFADLFPTLVDNRFDAMLDERDGSEQTGRTCTDDMHVTRRVMHILKDGRSV